MKAKSLIARLTAMCLALSVLFGSAASADSVTVTTGRLNLRKEADSSSKSISIVEKGDDLSFICEVDDWYQVSANGKIGFVMKDYVELDRKKIEADVEANTTLFSSAKSGRTTARVNMRELPLTSSDIEKVVPAKGSVEILGQCGEWYLVKYSSRTGYLTAEYVVVDGESSTGGTVESAPAQPDSSDNNASTPSEDVNYPAARTGKVGTRVNMREKPSTSSDIEKVLAKNTTVAVLGENGSWYKVSASGKVGYVSKAYITLNETSAAPSVPSAPSAPEVDIFDSSVSATTTERLNMRADASTSSSIVKVLSKGQSLTVLGEVGTWYKVSAGGKTGYVSKAYVRLASTGSDSSDGNDDVVPDGLVSYPAARTGATTERVNMRADANTSASVVKVLSKNAALTVLGEMNGFYQVKSGSSFGFVSKSYVVLGTSGSTESKPETEDKNEENKNESPSVSDTLYASPRTGTTTVKVNMRREPEGDVLYTLKADMSITLLGERGSWYKVSYNGTTGYISKEYVTDSTSVPSAPSAPSQPEKDEVTVPSTPAVTEGKTAYVSTGTVNMRKGPGTGYGVIKVLSRGDEITCYEQTDGWYRIKQGGDEGYLSAKYVTTTKPAVSAPSQPDNSGDTSVNVSGKVQMADWWTSNIQKTFARGVIATVTDVDTGISWQVLRSGGTNHADVQPLTAADTAKMKQAYGGKWSWNRRAIWVTINGVSYAASMNGMPHGTGSITTNNFDGHHCIHFLNSRTHTGNRWDTAHQSMVQKAFKAGQ